MKAWQGFALFAVGAAAGWLAAPRGGAERLAATETERDAAAAHARRAEAELAALRESRRRPRDPTQPPGAIPPDTRAPFDEPVPQETSPAAEATASPSPREALAAARRELEKALAAKDGAKALDLLRRLAALAREVPEARDDAMKLALDLNRDVNAGTGELGLTVQTYYGGLGDPGIRDLMLWSLESQGASPADFRVLSVWSLPWALSPDDTIRAFGTALRAENDRSVLSAIVENLGDMKKPAADALVAAVLADPQRDVGLRADAAEALATSRDPAIQTALESAAATESDPRFQAAARVSRVLRDPPAAGCLVVSTNPQGAADTAGIRAGDVIVAYNGRVVPNDSELRREIGAAAQSESVAVVVVRDGHEVSLQVKPGQLGITPLPVRPK